MPSGEYNSSFFFFSEDLFNTYVIDIPGILIVSLHTSILSGYYCPVIFLKVSTNGTTSATLYIHSKSPVAVQSFSLNKYENCSYLSLVMVGLRLFKSLHK